MLYRFVLVHPVPVVTCHTSVFVAAYSVHTLPSAYSYRPVRDTTACVLSML